MKKIFLFALVFGVLLVACKSEKKQPKQAVVENKVQKSSIEDGVYVAKVATSVLKWTGFKPTESHSGELKVKEGFFEVKEGKLALGKFTLNMESISVTDIPADSKMNGKLVGHLKNVDFFDVENHPTATFEISSVEGTKVKGNLTIKGITKPVEFIAKLSEAGTGIAFSSEPFKIDRTVYNIQYKSKRFFENLADKFIKDEIEISFKVEASKQLLIKNEDSL